MKRKPTILLVMSTLVSILAVDAGASITAYPKKGQSDSQMQKDKSSCASWATKQTGIDPAQLLEQQQNAPSTEPSDTRLRSSARGAGRGAAAGAIGGAVTGNPGTGAAVGAAVGGAAGLSRRRQEERARQEINEGSKAQTQQQMAEFEKAQKTCLEGKGYAVS